ncbi:MAG: hypothetical protein OEZ39_04245 [Gammaproteobacteria bacterium]|nr:hypothetical protein [Gammaproteobacteria bacterium]MDH5651069.1 hypothetical protein [Gammaproteobacteria bacterium]
MVGVSLALTLAGGIYVWLAANPQWLYLKISLGLLCSSVLLLLLFIGDELHWWSIDNQFLDNLAIVWLVVTLLGAGIYYWLN